MAIERLIGIDFGTSTSAVKVKSYQDGKPIGDPVTVDFVRFDGKATVPTLVFRTKDGAVLVGYAAENSSERGTLHQNFKMDLISPEEEKRATALESTELFFRHMFEAYQSQAMYLTACDKETTYISYPAKWTDTLRETMMDIAERAGFKNIQGINEPAAAVQTVLVQEGTQFRSGYRDYVNLLMIDMGAGTTDLVLCRYYPKKPEPRDRMEIVLPWPPPESPHTLGGREIDKAMCEHIKEMAIQLGVPVRQNFNDQYLDQCKRWKENTLSVQLNRNESVKRIGFLAPILDTLGIEDDPPPISRRTFEGLLQDYIALFPRLVTECLNEAGWQGRDIDYVLLTGGHSQWYFTDEILTGKLSRFGNPGLTQILAEPRRCIRLSLPQETVALGLVYQRITVGSDGNNNRSTDGVKFCGFCGKSMPGFANYCGYCGKKLGAAVVQKQAYPFPQAEASQPQPRPAPPAPPRPAKIVCPCCDTPLPANAKFCGKCSTVIKTVSSTAPPSANITCPGCGAVLPSAAKFCGKCGTTL